MIELKLQRPYIDINGKVYEDLERHYAEDENGVKYKIKQVETSIIYDEAVDIVPCRYHYVATNEKTNEELQKTTVEQ